VDPIGDRQWLTLGLARALLGSNEATLRQWADNGLVRAFRTPGGHRRFSTEDLNSLIEEGHPGPDAGVHVGGHSSVLPRIRRRVKGETRPHSPAWMEKFDDNGHQRMRTLGREFLDLCIDFIEQPTHQETLDAAADLGTTYGVEIASRGIPLADALQAFIFFRNATTEAIRPTLTKRSASAQEVSGALEQLTKLTDQVLVSLTSCYSQEPLPQAVASRKSK
jgi:hypothetical protein